MDGSITSSKNPSYNRKSTFLMSVKCDIFNTLYQPRKRLKDRNLINAVWIVINNVRGEVRHLQEPSLTSILLFLIV